MLNSLLVRRKSQIQKHYFQSPLEKRYQELVVKHHIQRDTAQVEVLGHLQQLLQTLLEQPTHPVLRRFTLKNTPKSLYIFGDVGRGKSMLMDFFFQACPMEKKRRLHFHQFMQEVHQFLHEWRQQHDSDPLEAYANQFCKTTRLLCFDEFEVTDIADAMILSRLFTQLITHGLIFVATSNSHPDDLYKAGLQRQLFLPFIEQLKQTATILELIAKEDYRLAHFQQLQQAFHIGLGQTADIFLRNNLTLLINDAATEAIELTIHGRNVPFKAAHGDILYTSFAELCQRALGAADYLLIAQTFTTIFIANIPQLSFENRDETRRFMILIDVLYEQQVKLICTLAVAIYQLSDGGLELKRTQSRLMEMQSKHYLTQRY